MRSWTTRTAKVRVRGNSSVAEWVIRRPRYYSHTDCADTRAGKNTHSNRSKLIFIKLQRSPRVPKPLYVYAILKTLGESWQAWGLGLTSAALLAMALSASLPNFSIPILGEKPKIHSSGPYSLELTQ